MVFSPQKKHVYVRMTCTVCKMDQKFIEQFYFCHSVNYYEVITHKSIVIHTFIQFSGEDNKIL